MAHTHTHTHNGRSLQKKKAVSDATTKPVCSRRVLRQWKMTNVKTPRVLSFPIKMPHDPHRCGSTFHRRAQNVAFRFDLNLVAHAHIYAAVFTLVETHTYIHCACNYVFLLSHVKLKIAFTLLCSWNEMEWKHMLMPLNECLTC